MEATGHPQVERSESLVPITGRQYCSEVLEDISKREANPVND
jgi:hypothetical protein